MMSTDATGPKIRYGSSVYIPDGPLEPGRYRVRLLEAEGRISSASGKQFILIKCEVLEAPNEGRTVWYSYAYRQHNELPTTYEECEKFQPIEAWADIRIREFNGTTFNEVRRLEF